MLVLTVVAVLALASFAVRVGRRAEGRLSELCRPIDREGQ